MSRGIRTEHYHSTPDYGGRRFVDTIDNIRLQEYGCNPSSGHNRRGMSMCLNIQLHSYACNLKSASKFAVDVLASPRGQTSCVEQYRDTDDQRTTNRSSSDSHNLRMSCSLLHGHISIIISKSSSACDGVRAIAVDGRSNSMLSFGIEEVDLTIVERDASGRADTCGLGHRLIAFSSAL